MVLGWTRGDLRTFELNPEPGNAFDAVHHAASGGGEDLVAATWSRLHKRRMDRLAGCPSPAGIDWDPFFFRVLRGAQ